MCCVCGTRFFPPRCAEHSLAATALELQRQRIAALEGALRSMVSAVAQHGVLLHGSSYETMRTAIIRAAVVMPELKGILE